MQVRLQSGLEEAKTGRSGADFEESNQNCRLGQRVLHAGLDCAPAVRGQ